MEFLLLYQCKCVKIFALLSKDSFTPPALRAGKQTRSLHYARDDIIVGKSTKVDFVKIARDFSHRAIVK